MFFFYCYQPILQTLLRRATAHFPSCHRLNGTFGARFRGDFFFFERHTVNDCLKFILVSNARVTAATQWKEPSFEWEHLQ